MRRGNWRPETARLVKDTNYWHLYVSRLLVGIGGGVPVKTDNGMIRLGDVVVRNIC
jgi:hypothetical protein